MISATDLGGEVELSDERESHIAETHPELLPRCKGQIGNTLKRIGVRHNNQILLKNPIEVSIYLSVSYSSIEYNTRNKLLRARSKYFAVDKYYDCL